MIPEGHIAAGARSRGGREQLGAEFGFLTLSRRRRRFDVDVVTVSGRVIGVGARATPPTAVRAARFRYEVETVARDSIPRADVVLVEVAVLRVAWNVGTRLLGAGHYE